MRVVVMEDYQRAVERLDAFALLEGHDVVVQSSRPETVGRAGRPDRRCGGDRPDSRAHADRRRVAGPAPHAEADLPDGPGNAPHRPRGVHAPWNRGLHRRRVGAGACRAHARTDSCVDALHRRRRRRAPRRLVADDRRPGAARTHARDHRLREHRCARRRLRQRARDERARLGTRGLARARQRRRLRGRCRTSMRSASARMSSASTSS